MEFLPYEAFEGEVASVASGSDEDIIAGVKRSSTLRGQYWVLDCL